MSARPFVEIRPTETGNAPPIGRANFAVRLSGGSIVVSDYQASDLKWYDGQGRFLRTAGRRGGGPGEFRSIMQLGRVGSSDTVLVLSPPKYVLLDSAGQLVYERMIDFGDDPTGSTFGFYVLPDRSVLHLVEVSGAEPQPVGNHRRQIAYYRADPVNRTRQLLLTSPGGELYTAPDGTTVSPLFAPTTKLAIGTSNVYIGDTALDTIHVGLAGNANGRIGLGEANREPSAADLRLARSEILEWAKRHQRVPDYNRFIDKLESEARYPRFRSLVAGLNDEVWVQEWPRINGTHRRWLVYKPSGVLLASALLPADFEVTQVGEDFILGIAKDQFDRDLIQIYRLDRQP